MVAKKPSGFGYEFRRWTLEQLATYTAQQTGIKLIGKQVRRILEQKKTLRTKQNIP
ncbi:winged helix-turn-helix domain-containing protein [Brasilonema sp. UFV-L1]|uniref:winged helix-turn-helix domain-containing protein n=1 Tax=Brasilonema sp. UFV-L1 TaxID=2234130 RepID=UPI00145CA19F